MFIKCRAWIFFFAVNCLAGCAYLDIDVSVYEGSTPVDTANANLVIVQIQADNSGFFRKKDPITVDSLVNDVGKDFIRGQGKNYLSAFKKSFRVKNDKEPSETKESELAGNANKAASQDWMRIESNLRKELERVLFSSSLVMQELEILTVEVDKEVSSIVLSAKGSAAYSRILIAKKMFDLDFKEASKKINFLVENAVSNQEIAEQIAAVLTDRTPDRLAGISSDDSVGGRIVGSPTFNKHISKIVSDTESWSLYNENSFTAFGGDAQFVAVSKGLTEFRQKSLDFDPSAVVAAGGELTKAGLKLFASISSGKFKVSSQNPEEVLGPNKALIRQNKETLKRRSFARRQFLTTLATIYDNTKDPSADASKIKKSLKDAVLWFEAQMLIPAED